MRFSWKHYALKTLTMKKTFWGKVGKRCSSRRRQMFEKKMGTGRGWMWGEDDSLRKR
jgi:hypothetical protein